MKKLPIGIQSIDKILGKGDYVYVDKTPFALELIEGGAPHYFFSRPRRFGKSLFLSTLAEIFQGNNELFKGCSIYNSDYDWQPHPVLQFDFSEIANESAAALGTGLQEAIEDLGELHGVAVSGSSYQSQLKRLITALAKKAPVVALIDEYDGPIIDNLKKPEVAEENRELLRSFYKVLKGQEHHIRFTFITGISKFSQVSLFSGPNHLDDITMHPQYATMLGYTEQELRYYFEEHIQAITQARNTKGQKTTDDEVLAEIKHWYNGYRFSEEENCVYNPFSTLQFLSKKKPQSYWYDSGTPSLLVEEIKKHPETAVPLSGTSARASKLMGLSSLESIDLTALMFQAGYLTITDYDAASQHYHLDFPNEEVREAFLDSLVTHFARLDTKLSSEMEEALEQHDLAPLLKKVQGTLSGFSYQLFSKAHEQTYQGFLLSLLSGLGLKASAERANNLGRVDLLVELPKTTYVMELKLDKSAEAALQQIKEKQYHVPYLGKGKEVAIVGINFSSKTRNLAGCCGELLNEKGKLVRILTTPYETRA